MIVDGKINLCFDFELVNMVVCNVVCLDVVGIVMLVIVCNLISFYDFVSFFCDEFKCSDVLYLDGSILCMYFMLEVNMGLVFGVMIVVVKGYGGK